MANKIWVVEMNFSDGKGFVPTNDVGVNRDQARWALDSNWKRKIHKSRIRKYVPEKQDAKA